MLALLLLYSEQCLRPAGARFSKLLKLKLGLEFSQEKLKKNLGKFPIFSKVLRRNLGKNLRQLGSCLTKILEEIQRQYAKTLEKNFRSAKKVF